MSAEAETTHPLESELMISLLQWLEDEAKCPITLHIMRMPLIIHKETIRDSKSYEYEGCIDELIKRKKRNSRTGKYWFAHPELQDTKIYECESHEQQITKGWPVSINHTLKITIERLIETIQTEFEKYLDNYKVQEHPKYDTIKLLQTYKIGKKEWEGAAIFGHESSMIKYMRILHEDILNEHRPKAMKWAEKLVKHYNNRHGKFRLAQAYDIPDYDEYEVDKGKANKLYEELAEIGDTRGIFNAGINYENGGNNLEKNIEKAHHCFEKGYNNDSFDCSVKFANYCHDGTGCEVDKKKARKIYKKISKDMMAIASLPGYCHGVHRMNQTIGEACYNYGMILFMKGDIINGLRYIDCAQKNGCENAKKKMEDICRAGREDEEESNEENEQENDEEEEASDEEDASDQEENADY